MIKTISDEYVYKKEVDWSLFNYGFAIPIEHQVVFSQVAGRFIQRGESKDVNLYLNGKSYKAKLNNNRIDKKFGPHADIVQIRYTQNSDLAQALRGCFQRSYAYMLIMCLQPEILYGEKNICTLIIQRILIALSWTKHIILLQILTSES